MRESGGTQSCPGGVFDHVTPRGETAFHSAYPPEQVKKKLGIRTCAPTEGEGTVTWLYTAAKPLRGSVRISG